MILIPPAPDPRADLAAFVAQTLSPGAPVFVGASGGGDSTALTLLLAPIARGQGRRLVAGIVDHALREGSDRDAAHAAAIVGALGAETRIVRLDWPQGPRSAQTHARSARYSALATLAREVGAGTLFLGHTRDDQAETLRMRLDAGSGPRGLAGMAPLSPCPIWPAGRDLLLARPLLQWRRETLRQLLRTESVDWLEDPANALARFARVRARAQLVETGETEALAAMADAHARTAGAVDREAREFLDASVVVAEDRVTIAGVTEDAACARALAVVAAAVGGAGREPAPEAVARLAARLATGQDGTLAGARFRAGRVIHVSRDRGGVLGRRGGGAAIGELPLPEGLTVVWDGRLALTAREAGLAAIAPDAADTALRPLIRRGGAVATLAATPEVAARWLVADRIDRLLWRAPRGSGA